jgi:transposase InsO family protein
MKENKEVRSIAKLAGELEVSRSGYYSWLKRKPSKHEIDDKNFGDFIKDIFEDHYSRYGSPRIWAELKECGIKISPKRVARLMKEQKLSAKMPKSWKKTTDSNHDLKKFDNLLNRDFNASCPGEKWVSDITYIKTNSGWQYLTIILDLWDRKIIGWSIGNNLSTVQVCNALIMAILNRTSKANLIFHSDRGVQYCSDIFRITLNKLCPTVRQSMSRKGNCWDNACAESFFNTLKRELWIIKKNKNVEFVKNAILELLKITISSNKKATRRKLQLI